MDYKIKRFSKKGRSALMFSPRAAKKGVSPVIATVLLVVMVIVIGLIIFLWFNSFTQEAVTKFGGRNIALVCDDVQFLSNYDGSTISISNIGNVPIYSLNLKITSSRSHKTEDIQDITDNWPALTGLRQGGIYSESSSALNIKMSGATEALLVPILIGTSSEGEKTHVCEDRHGQELLL